MLFQLVRKVFCCRQRETRRNDTLDPNCAYDISVCKRKKCVHSRRIIGQVHEQRDSIQTTILLKVLLEEPRRLHVDTHGAEDNVKVVLVTVVNGFRVARSVDETCLTTDLGGDL